MDNKKIKRIFQKDYYFLTRELLPLLLGIGIVLGILFLTAREIYVIGCFQSYRYNPNYSGPTFEQCREGFTK